MLKNARPSEYFLGAILRAYDLSVGKSKPVTCSALWDHIVMECLRSRDGFRTMFAWDESIATNINRIGTIAETIRRGHVPGLLLSKDEQGREFVREARAYAQMRAEAKETITWIDN